MNKSKQNIDHRAIYMVAFNTIMDNLALFRKYLLSIFFVFLTVMLSSCGGAGSCVNCAPSLVNVNMDTNNGGIANGAVNVSLSPSVVLKFSTPMNPSTVNANTITLTTSPNNVLTVSDNTAAITNITANPDNTTFSFSSASPLMQNTIYYVIVNSGVKTSTGVSVTGSFSFTTGDFSAPMVSIISPSNNATGVSLSPMIQLQFSEAVNHVESPNIKMYKGSVDGSTVAISSATLGTNNTYSFSPSVALQEQTTYYVVMSSGIKDNSGNALVNATYSFTTGDLSAPTVSIISPSSNATGVSLSPMIQLQFSEAVNNVSSANITLYKGSDIGEGLAISPLTVGANNTYNFSPLDALQEQTTYYVVISSRIKDNSGNPLATTSFNFTTGDFTAPTVSLISPSNNATGIASNSIIGFQFSETVNNVNSTNVTLHLGSDIGPIVDIGTITAGANNSYSFTPSAPLGGGWYYLVFSNSIVDFSGNALVASVFRFTTDHYEAEEM